MDYKKLKNTWNGLKSYDLNGKIKEEYAGPVTLSLPKWRNYIASGNHILLGSGGVIPGGTTQTPFGGGGAVYFGHVQQGYGGMY